MSSSNSGSAKLQQAQVIYYLSRGGSLEQPHLIDVSYSDRHGLLLKDVKRRLVAIRGRGMPELFSWSYKTRYKAEFIWHDVSDNDAILPVSDTEYVLKGSEIVDGRGVLDDSDGEIQCKNMLKDHARLTKSSPVQIAARRAEEHDDDSSPTKPEECVVIAEAADASAGESVKIYKRRPNSDQQGRNATTQTDRAEEAAAIRIKVEENEADSRCRGEKPSNLPQPCPLQMKLEQIHHQAPELRMNKACSSGSPAKSDNARSDHRSSLIFRQMLPCADVSTRIHHRSQQGSTIYGSGNKMNNNNNGYGGQQQQQQQTKLDFSKSSSSSSNSASWWRSRGAKLGNLDLYRNRSKISSCAAGRDVDARRSYDLSHSLLRGTPDREPTQHKQRYSTLTRYRPRHSFSNSDYFDAYDFYLQPEKVNTASELLEWSMNRNSNSNNNNNNNNPATRQSNASRLSLESLYEVDCNKSVLEQQQQNHAAQQSIASSRSDFLGKCDDSPRASVSSHIISKLVLEAKAKAKASEDKESSKVAWWDEIRTPRRSEERFRKNKLDWEKNLQDAVNMIIRPGAQEQRKIQPQ